MGGYLEDELKGRLRDVLARGRVPIEPDLRRLAEEGAAVERILRGELRRREERLAGLGSDPGMSLTEIAEELQRARALRDRADELRVMLDELDRRARELRAGWLAGAATPTRSSPAASR
ncbi:MAG: hypothetical protein WD249_13880 [Gaiellaceae bacterium]